MKLTLAQKNMVSNAKLIETEIGAPRWVRLFSGEEQTAESLANLGLVQVKPDYYILTEKGRKL